jgi:GNS1/SUR4 family
MVNIMHLFVLVKASYILESVIAEIGRRKVHKTNYVVFHHIVTASMFWYIANFHPGGQPSFSVFINSLIHLYMDVSYLIMRLISSKVERSRFIAIFRTSFWVMVSFPQSKFW